MTITAAQGREPSRQTMKQKPQIFTGHWLGFYFALPATILLMLIIVIPIIAVAFLSLTDYTLGALTWKIIGLENYQQALSDDVFIRSIANTGVYVATVVPLSVGLGLLIALLIHGRTRTRRLYEVIYFLPVTGTLVAMAIVWQFLLHSRIGPVNMILSNLGFERIGFFSEPETALFSLAAIGVWQLVGFNMILFLAGFR